MKNKNLVRLLARVCTAIVLVTFSSASAQQLSLNVVHSPLDQLSIADIDFSHFTNDHLYFTLTIISDIERLVHLEVGIDISLADGNGFPNAATLITKSFLVPRIRTITNLDLGKNADIITQSFDYSSEAKDKIQKLAFATGRLPAGTYTFNLKVVDDTTSSVSAAKTITLSLTNISHLDLLSPQDGSTVPTVFPLFQWIYDGDSVEVSVYEFLSQQHSKEEAASGVPQLDVRSGDPNLPVGSRTFQYPTSAARPLQPGKTYVWKVRGLTAGAGGAGNDINSEIWQFTMPSSVGDLNTGQQNFISQLQLLLGGNPDILNQLMNGSLQVTGEVTIDGHSVSPADLQRILNDLAANPDRVVGIQIVDE